MAALGHFLRTTEQGYSMWCPGCKGVHHVTHGWTFNGNAVAPTFSPSLLVRSGHYIPNHEGGCWCDYNARKVAAGEKPAPFECSVCHSFIVNGQWQFLGDCTHHLVGQTVPMVADWWE